jgi:magnesium transporter
MDAKSGAPRSPSDPAGTDGGSGGAAGAAGGPASAPPDHQAGNVRIVCWSPSGVEGSSDIASVAAMVGRPDACLWVDLIDPPESDVRIVTSALGIHPLIAEDIAERNQRAKIEEYNDDVVHIVLFDLDYIGEVEPQEIDLVLGKRFLLSVHGPDPDLAERVPKHNGAGAALAKGPDFLLYAIIDHVVDGYFPVLDKIADEIDDLQDRVIEEPSEWTLKRLFVLKRELLEIRRAVSPAREVLNQLTNRELSVVRPDHIVYFRDVYDHLIRVTDELDNYRDLVSGTVEIYLSTINNNLSTIMKRLTGVTVILAGIGAAAGIFGMSEAGALIGNGEPTGFWLTTVVIVVLAVVSAAFLRRIGWI